MNHFKSIQGSRIVLDIVTHVTHWSDDSNGVTLSSLRGTATFRFIRPGRPASGWRADGEYGIHRMFPPSQSPSCQLQFEPGSHTHGAALPNENRKSFDTRNHAVIEQSVG